MKRPTAFEVYQRLKNRKVLEDKNVKDKIIAYIENRKDENS